MEFVIIITTLFFLVFSKKNSFTIELSWVWSLFEFLSFVQNNFFLITIFLFILYFIFILICFCHKTIASQTNYNHKTFKYKHITLQNCHIFFSLEKTNVITILSFTFSLRSLLSVLLQLSLLSLMWQLSQLSLLSHNLVCW